MNFMRLLAIAIPLVAVCPAAADDQVTKLKFESAFPVSTLLFENSKYFVERVKAMTGGKLQIEMLPPGAVVPPFEVLDAVHKGVLDGAHSGPTYWVGKNRAAGLFGASPGGGFGMDLLDFLGWMYEAGGFELYQEFYQKQLQRNIVALPMSAAGPQILGWFKKPVKSWGDLKGRKCRQAGITAEVFSKSGMNTVNIPGGEIIPSGQRGVIDCAEFVGPAEDMRIGFHTVWKYAHMPSTHEPATVGEIIINAAVWNKLPDHQKEIIKSATMEATLRSQMVMNRLNADALAELRAKHGVTVVRTPPDILKKTLETWDRMVKEDVAKNPFFKKVYDSQRSYASRVVPARRDIYPPYELSADHYWPQRR